MSRDRRVPYVVIPLLLWYLLLFNSAWSEAKSDLDRFDLHGAVRTVVTKYPQLTTTHQFDRGGRLATLELVPANQVGAVRYVYLYDEGGRLTEEDAFAPDSTIADRKTFHYGVDEQGRLSAQVAATGDGSFVRAEFFLYDRRGLVSEEVMVTAQGIAEKSLFDVRGHLIYHARYFQARLVLEASHHYDALDRLAESRFYGSDGDPMRTDRYKYDQAGRRIEQTSDFFRQSHLRKSVLTYDFDQAGNWTKETIQRWSIKNRSLAMTETVISRERTITYY